MTLNLNRDKIRGSIEKFFVLQSRKCATTDFEVKPGTRRRIHITVEEDVFYMDFHFKGNGSTSIDNSSGGNKEIKEEISEYIINDPECALGDVNSNNQCFVAPNIEHDDFIGIMELLEESEFEQSHSSKNFANHEMHQFVGKYNENLTIHYYPTTKKIMVQGRPLLLFNEALVYVTELLELDEIPKVFNDLFEVKIEKSDVEEQYQYYFPNSFQIHSGKLKKVLHQAIYNLQITGDMYDQSFLVFPSFKALEGHLKIEMHKYSIPLVKNKFNMFKKDTTGKRYELKEEFRANISDDKRLHLENSYAFYNNQRHVLFHWADQSLPVDETKIIENNGETKGLIMNTFKLIDEYYLL
ncbi:type II toxin-antitoxin system RnlA family toxin [Cytobacillus spongiae]|uniref:type II toxin-antitoxin system RnlA family toxin n=1 Tax=Cytobacillus spongiae TaxID=2901381 RepID=UPI001F2DB893|nr:type II toxin-antitoxin system RnlA family toxin [Cytobacillus spongiae]UII56248.1 type II toxin-antitoxin system RnlA family toxin [Cytobacillus spongiae]